MEHVRLECLKIASAEVQAGVWGAMPNEVSAAGAVDAVSKFIFVRAEQLLSWVTKEQGGPAAPEPDYERLPASVEGA